MAVKYAPQFGGYIVDVPQFYFRRADDQVFISKKVTQCTLDPQTDFLEVRAGWSKYAVANIPGQSNMTVNITLGEFRPDFFSMANATDMVGNGNFEVPYTENLKPNDQHKVTLKYKATIDSIRISGLKPAEGETLAEGEFKAEADENGQVTITFYADEVNEMEIFYTAKDETAQVANMDGERTACGEIVLKWPRHRWAA